MSDSDSLSDDEDGDYDDEIEAESALPHTPTPIPGLHRGPVEVKLAHLGALAQPNDICLQDNDNAI